MTGLLFTLGLVGLAVAPPAVITATFYTLRVYLDDERRPRSWVLRDCVVAGVITSLAVCYLGWLAWLRLVGSLPALSPEAIDGLVFSIDGLAAIPVLFAIEIRRRRWRPRFPRRGGRMRRAVGTAAGAADDDFPRGSSSAAATFMRRAEDHPAAWRDGSGGGAMTPARTFANANEIRKQPGK